MLLVGKGDKLKQFKKIVKKNKIADNVTFIGVINNVNEILQVMDIFLMPSRFEGLPFAALEAQASGVKTIVSDKITDEVVVTKNIIRLPLKTKNWVLKILDMDDFEERKVDLLSDATNFMKSNSKGQYNEIIN